MVCMLGFCTQVAIRRLCCTCGISVVDARLHDDIKSDYNWVSIMKLEKAQSVLKCISSQHTAAVRHVNGMTFVIQH